MDTQEPAAVELVSLSRDGTAREPIPLVLIEGWAAGTSAMIFAGLDSLLNERKPIDAQNRRLLVIKCGAYSSLWDRAHEIYYALRGGRCDYGDEHSRQHNHARFGKTHTHGLYENWSERYPLHFAGHSFGGVTIAYLQQLLAKGVLPGSPAMLKSIVTISSPHRGTPLAAAFGQLEGTGGQKRFSLGWVMAISVHLAQSLNIIGSDIYDFGGDHWMRKDSTDSDDDDDEADKDAKYRLIDSVYDYLNGRSLASSADSASYDMLISSMIQHNQGSVLCEKTFYRSYAAVTDLPIYFPPLAYCHRIISLSAPDRSDPDPEWVESDALIPLKSQMHPGDCHETICLHIPKDVLLEEEPPPLPGVWHVKLYEDTTHFGLVDYLWSYTNSSKTRSFWSGLGDWLIQVDEEAEANEHENVKDVSVSIVDS